MGGDGVLELGQLQATLCGRGGLDVPLVRLLQGKNAGNVIGDLGCGLLGAGHGSLACF
jgi:hypothetical protein